jgi:hypothetical protein
MKNTCLLWCMRSFPQLRSLASTCVLKRDSCAGYVRRVTRDEIADAVG